MVFMSDATRYPPVQLGLVLLFLAMVRSPRLRRPALVAVASVILANTFTDVLKHTWPVLRPSVELWDAVVRVEGGRGPGTASAHSANMAAVCACLFFNDRWWGAGWLAVAVLTGLSRIYVGVHYPSQVLLGWSIGVAIGLGLSWAVEKWWPSHGGPPLGPTGPSDPGCQSADLRP